MISAKANFYLPVTTTVCCGNISHDLVSHRLGYSLPEAAIVCCSQWPQLLNGHRNGKIRVTIYTFHK